MIFFVKNDFLVMYLKIIATICRFLTPTYLIFTTFFTVTIPLFVFTFTKNKLPTFSGKLITAFVAYFVPNIGIEVAVFPTKRKSLFFDKNPTSMLVLQLVSLITLFHISLFSLSTLMILVFL
jgi:hypothetical protein